MARGAARERVLEIRVGELRQLFDSMDPAPFRERDLDPRAEEFIVGWARELHADASFVLELRFDRGAGAEDAEIAQQAVAEFFRTRALATRRELRQLLHNGRISLAIGLAVMAAALVASDLMSEYRFGFVRESLVIGGWVALWRPLEIFLYDWWPIRAKARLFDRLARSRVRLAAPAEPKPVHGH